MAAAAPRGRRVRLLPPGAAAAAGAATRKGVSVAVPSAAVLSAALQESVLRNLNVSLAAPTTLTRQRTRGVAQASAIAPQSQPQPAAAGPSLAQRLGLEPAPRRLSEAEWKEAERSCARRQRHNPQPCPICHEDFRLEQQVLLSCSHVFHAACLRAFERFSGQRICPMCRARDYERRPTTEGADRFRHVCATRIQAWYRGERARRAFRALLEASPPRDPRRRRVVVLRKLVRATDHLASLVEQRDSELDALFAECDSSLQQSRSAIAEAEARFRPRLAEEKWADVLRAARERACPDCPICMTSFGGGREEVLLSCSHVFHDVCLVSFERFAAQTGMHAGCPLCRAPYEKLALGAGGGGTQPESAIEEREQGPRSGGTYATSD